MFRLFSSGSITRRAISHDHESIWQSWAQERAYRIGILLSSSAVLLSIFAIAINAVYLGTVAVVADLFLFIGCIASIWMTKRRGEQRYFVWWPMLTGYWIAIAPNLYITGGVSSPFFPTFMILLFVGAVVVQTEFRLRTVFAAVSLNIIGWAAIAFFFKSESAAQVPVFYNVTLNIDCLLAISICIYGFLKTEQDLSREFEERYKELASAQASLQREENANASKSAFLANISHELRTPLGAILGYVDLLLDERESYSTDVSDQLSIIKRNGQQLSRLVNDLLDLSKIEAGKLEIERIPTDFPQILTEIYETFSLVAVKKSVQLRISLLTPIPTSVLIDPIRFRQILINIVGNALKFTEEGQVDIRIEYLPSNGELKLAVRDTGRGLTRDEQEKLFQPFTQADASMARKYGGTGLGLNLSRRLARLMQGDLTLTFSRPGEGSIFTLLLYAPIATSANLVSEVKIDAPKLVSNGLKEMPSLSLSGVRVLVVDDTADNRSLIRKFLELVDARVETAQDGTEGIQKALDQRYDVVLMDIQMPGLDGLQATSLLRQRNYKAPIIALTAHAMKQDRERCLEAGCSDYLAKPVSRHELISTIARLTKKRSRPVASVVDLEMRF